MYGAILGDIIGSRFEFDRGGKTKNFKLFEMDSQFTDDTVMTIAVADALMKCDVNAEEETFKKELIRTMRFWASHYPHAGYGGGFRRWLVSYNPRPYGSWGNGSAMRVSSVGWLYNSLNETICKARWTAEITHNHPEGIKGAECTAAVIYLARTYHEKQEIKEFVDKYYHYNLSKSLDELRKQHKHEESCMDSLPKALTAFFEGEDFEDVVRNAVSLGGDTDTIAAIAGSMAEAYWGIPEDLLIECDRRVTRYMRSVMHRFDELRRKIAK